MTKSDLARAGDRDQSSEAAGGLAMGAGSGSLWARVVGEMARRLEGCWHDLIRSRVTLREDDAGGAEAGMHWLRWQGPLEPLDEELEVGLSHSLYQGLLYRLLGGAEADLENDRAGSGPISPGAMELQLLEPLVLGVASEFCTALHQAVGIPVMAPCLWLSPMASREDRQGAELQLWMEGVGFAGRLSVRVPVSLLAILEQVPGQPIPNPTPREDARAVETGAIEVVLAEVELDAGDLADLAVGDLIPLGRAPAHAGEWVWLDIPGQGRVLARVVEGAGGLEVQIPREGPEGEETRVK